jgi:hypothetical protein
MESSQTDREGAMNPTPGGSQAKAALRGAGTGANHPSDSRSDAVSRTGLRAALQRELAVATAAGDEAARQRLFASLQSVITT